MADPSGRAVCWRGCAATRLLELWVRMPPGSWMSVCHECCVLSRRVLCDGLLIRTEEVCPMSMTAKPRAGGGRDPESGISASEKKKQDRQYTYNVTVRRFRATNVAVEKK